MRLDVFLVKRGYFLSRNKASEALKRGEVFVQGKLEKKASKEISGDEKIEIKSEQKPFVSLGGYKLEKAIKEFCPEIEEFTFADVGASTGGFTDCLLRYGAKRVFCIDVGRNLLDKALAQDERVVVMDETNARYLTSDDFFETIDAAVVDCSFISLEYILPALKNIVKRGGYVIALIKPQFELDRRVRLKNGILRDKAERFSVIKKLTNFAESISLSVCGITEAPLKNDKNVEYLAYIFNDDRGSIDLPSVLDKLK